MNVKVSVIIPVYNCEKYIEECIESLINQTLQECEFIFVNDGSKDKSEEIIKKYADKDERITLINQKNSGVSVARNVGIKKAVGEYIGFVDADDYVDSNYYEKLYNREPTLKEISTTLDMDESDILMAMESGQDVCSLHQVIYQNEGDEIHLEDKLEQQSDLIEQTVDNIYIQELLQKLNEQERKLIELRYFQNQTQAVIAGIMGISQVQVSRMEKKILEKLRMHSLN